MICPYSSHDLTYPKLDFATVKVDTAQILMKNLNNENIENQLAKTSYKQQAS